MDSVSLGKKIKEYRDNCGMGRQECSERIGITEKYLADIERGTKVPQLSTFVKILNILSASADDVLQDSLVVGYHAKSNDLLEKLEPLDPIRRKQALEILDSVITSLQDS